MLTTLGSVRVQLGSKILLVRLIRGSASMQAHQAVDTVSADGAAASASQSTRTQLAGSSEKKSKKKAAVHIDADEIARRRAEKAAKKEEQRRLAESNTTSAAASDIERDGDSQAGSSTLLPEQLGFKSREFVEIPQGASVRVRDHGVRSLKIMTWNMLAQALVRRTLFPGSDMLKWKERGPILMKEFLYYKPDVACLQEVDKVDVHGPILQNAGYDFFHTTGYAAKLHGLCIVWRKNAFDMIQHRTVKLDSAPLGSSPAKTGCSRVTRNIGLFVALKYREGTHPDGSPDGIILVTHHLFWHARHVYERSRQVAILLQQLEAFRSSHPDWADWPCFLAGDFNIQPDEATYALLLGTELTEAQRETLERSRVVHCSLDIWRQKQATATAKQSGQENDNNTRDEEDDDDAGGGDDEGGEPTATGDTGETYAQPDGDEDRVLKNTRPPREEDGLLTLEELQAAYEPWKDRLKSAYGSNYGRLADQTGNFFGQRGQDGSHETKPLPDNDTLTRKGYFEPAYTNVTPLWRCTLDYIFSVAFPASESSLPKTSERVSPRVTHLLPTHRLEDLEPGLPRKGKEPSDHVALMAQYEF